MVKRSLATGLRMERQLYLIALLSIGTDSDLQQAWAALAGNQTSDRRVRRQRKEGETRNEKRGKERAVQ